VVGIERVNLQVESRAREQAQADFVSYLVGEWTPRSEVAHWPARYKDAYESEFERLPPRARGTVNVPRGSTPPQERGGTSARRVSPSARLNAPREGLPGVGPGIAATPAPRLTLSTVMYVLEK
jgi:hypothetical protein